MVEDDFTQRCAADPHYYYSYCKRRIKELDETILKFATERSAVKKPIVVKREALPKVTKPKPTPAYIKHKIHIAKKNPLDSAAIIRGALRNKIVPKTTVKTTAVADNFVKPVTEPIMLDKRNMQNIRETTKALGNEKLNEKQFRDVWEAYQKDD